MRKTLLLWLLALTLPAAAQSSEGWRLGLQVGLNSPTGSWANTVKSGPQVIFSSTYPLDPYLGLGMELQFGQGKAAQAAGDDSRRFNTFAALGRIVLDFAELERGPRFYGVAGLGVARVSEDGGERIDLYSDPQGQVVTSASGGSTLRSSVRPMAQMGFGMTLPLQGNRRMVLEIRYQRVNTPWGVQRGVPATFGIIW